jgi:hypothetical protein
MLFARRVTAQIRERKMCVLGASDGARSESFLLTFVQYLQSLNTYVKGCTKLD